MQGVDKWPSVVHKYLVYKRVIYTTHCCRNNKGNISIYQYKYNSNCQLIMRQRNFECPCVRETDEKIRSRRGRNP